MWMCMWMLLLMPYVNAVGKEKIHECFNAFDVSILQTACPSLVLFCLGLTLSASLSLSLFWHVFEWANYENDLEKR